VIVPRLIPNLPYRRKAQPFAPYRIPSRTDSRSLFGKNFPSLQALIASVLGSIGLKRSVLTGDDNPLIFSPPHKPAVLPPFPLSSKSVYREIAEFRLLSPPSSEFLCLAVLSRFRVGASMPFSHL